MRDGTLGDYCDGSIYKHHDLFKSNPNAIQVMLYYDDVEVVNPIGSRTKKHKLGTVCLSCLSTYLSAY